nr:HepT-like ribonuclease domain-containing protein [Thioalkalivibrio sp.]
MDTALIEKKLAFIQTCVREIQELADPERLDTDVRERRFVEHALQLAIQAALDAASHWVSARRLGEPETNCALFRLLTDDRVIDRELSETLAAMAG